jgi:hypothetical protein
MYDKKGFILSLLKPQPKDIDLIQIDLDTDDVTISDIFRNFNKLFPANCRERYEIKNGYKVYAIICKSVLLSPLTGIVFIIGHNCEANVTSRNYLVMSIDESAIETEDKINKLNDAITDYMVSTIVDSLPDFEKFYCRYVYNDYEQTQSAIAF